MTSPRRTTRRTLTMTFFAFLRSTVSAIATSESKVGIIPYSSSVRNHHHHHHHHLSAVAQQAPQITLRLARRTDVPSIQRCNLATLPENYNQQFYANHLRQWPELALVAECTIPTTSTKSMQYNPFPGPPETNIVAYVLGKVEERHVNILDDEEAFRDNPYQSTSTQYITERLGHVTSLAVSEDFRRLGLARDLMLQLHHHLTAVYSVDSVGLHVRQSNRAAAGLYEGFGYEPSEALSNYYQDGEDAYFMKKRLTLPVIEKQTGIFGSLRRSKQPWETCADCLRLPRIVGQGAPSSSSAADNSQESPELLTGTM